MSNKPKNFLFFNLIPKTVFFIFIGIFVHLFLIFIVLFAIFVNSSYAFLSIYSALGSLIFTSSYFIYKYNYFDILKVPSYKSYLISKKKLITWIFITFNIYLLACWYLMILLGTFKGFNIKHPSVDALLLFGENSKTIKYAGIILISLHLFFIIVFSYTKNHLKNLLIISHEKLNMRRKNIEETRDAAKVIYQ